MKQDVVICDIDGCLLNTSAVLAEAKLQPSEADKWRYFNTYANDRKKVAFNYLLAEILKSLRDSGYKIIFSTARSEAIKVNTKIRLRSELGFMPDMYMRALGDIRPACEVKADHLKLIQKYYNPCIAIDDEDANLDMFSKNGLFVMKAI